MNTKNSDTLALIINHGLCVRQVPIVVYEQYLYREHYILKENEELIINENGQKLLQRIKTPLNGGKWMAKSCLHSQSTVRWNSNKDNLSDTIEEAVAKAIESLI